VTGIDAVVADLKAKGAEFTMEPNNIRPGIRIASCAALRVCRSSCSSARRLDALAKIQGGAQREQLLPCRRQSLCRLCRIRLGSDGRHTLSTGLHRRRDGHRPRLIACV
jgi:hypothetical protein